MISFLRLATLAAVLPLAAVCAPAGARDIHVDNQQGDDRWNGAAATNRDSADGPCRTIRRALELAERGDRILVRNTGEPYRESLTLQAARHSGSAGRPFALVGNGAVLDGSAPVPPDSWHHVVGDVYRFVPAKKQFQILYLEGRPARRRMVDSAQRPPELAPLEWCLVEGEVFFRVEAGKLPRQYPLTHTALPVGLTLYEVRHVVITDLVVQGFQLDGINAHDGVFDASLVGLTCRGNARSGISIGGASRVTIEACLLGDNGRAQLRTEGFSQTALVRSNLLDNSAPAIVRDGGRVDVSD